MIPQVLATIQAATSGERRTRATAQVRRHRRLAAVLGRVLGGLLVSANIDGLGWRPIFLVNVPIGLAGLVLAKQYVPTPGAGRLRLSTAWARSCSVSRCSLCWCR